MNTGLRRPTPTPPTRWRWTSTGRTSDPIVAATAERCGSAIRYEPARRPRCRSDDPVPSRRRPGDRRHGMAGNGRPNDRADRVDRESFAGMAPTRRGPVVQHRPDVDLLCLQTPLNRPRIALRAEQVVHSGGHKPWSAISKSPFRPGIPGRRVNGVGIPLSPPSSRDLPRKQRLRESTKLLRLVCLGRHRGLSAWATIDDILGPLASGAVFSRLYNRHASAGT
jgi:hypothetical protein